MTRLVDAWTAVVAVLTAGMPAGVRVYGDRPPRLETPAVFPVLLTSRTDHPDQCTVRDALQIGVTLVVAEADTAERGDTFRPLFDALLDTLDTELARQVPFGAQGSRRTAIGPAADFQEAVLAWQAVLELRVDATYNPTP